MASLQNAKVTTTPEDTRMERRERNVQKIMSCLERTPHAISPILHSSLENNVAAYQPVSTQTPEAQQLAILEQQQRQLSGLNPGSQTFTAHQTLSRPSTVDALTHLERDIQLVMSVVSGNHSRESTIAANTTK